MLRTISSHLPKLNRAAARVNHRVTGSCTPKPYGCSISTTTSTQKQEESGLYPGGVTVPYVSEIDFVKPESMDIWPAYRILNNDGTLREGASDPNLPKDVVVNMYTVMARLAIMDKVFYDAQRQGRISFYMTSGGEGAIHVGSAAGIDDNDMIYAQYREAGVLM